MHPKPFQDSADLNNLEKLSGVPTTVENTVSHMYQEEFCHLILKIQSLNHFVHFLLF